MISLSALRETMSNDHIGDDYEVCDDDYEEKEPCERCGCLQPPDMLADEGLCIDCSWLEYMLSQDPNY